MVDQAIIYIRYEIIKLKPKILYSRGLKIDSCILKAFKTQFKCQSKNINVQVSFEVFIVKINLLFLV